MGHSIYKSARITPDAGERRLQSEKTTLSHPLSVHFEGLCKHHHSVVGGSIARPPRRTCERGGRGGGGDGNLDLVARNGAFVWRHSVTRSRSVGQSCLEQAHDSRRVAKPDRGSRKTLDQAGAGAGFSGNPSKPVFPSAGLSSSPPSLLANPFFLPFRPPSAFTFFPLIHQRMTLNRPLPPSIQDPS